MNYLGCRFLASCTKGIHEGRSDLPPIHDMPLFFSLLLRTQTTPDHSRTSFYLSLLWSHWHLIYVANPLRLPAS